jgi:hypothetical protein
LFIAVTALGPALIMPGDGGNRVQEVYQNGAYLYFVFWGIISSGKSLGRLHRVFRRRFT